MTKEDMPKGFEINEVIEEMRGYGKKAERQLFLPFGPVEITMNEWAMQEYPLKSKDVSAN